MRIRLSVVALVFMVPLSACGGSSPAKPLNEHDYRSAVGRVCARTQTAYEKLLDSEASIRGATAGALAGRADAVSHLYLAQLPALRRLVPPKQSPTRQAAGAIARMRRLALDYSREAAEMRARPEQDRELSDDEIRGASYFNTHQTDMVRWVAYLNLNPWCWPPVAG